MHEFNLKNLSSDYFETSKEIFDELLGRTSISKNLKKCDTKIFNEMKGYEREEKSMNKENKNIQKKLKNNFGQNDLFEEELDLNLDPKTELSNLNSRKKTKNEKTFYHSRIASKNDHVNVILNEVINKNQKKLSFNLKENRDSSFIKKQQEQKPKIVHSESRKNIKRELEMKQEIKDFEKSKEFQVRDKKIAYMKKLNINKSLFKIRQNLMFQLEKQRMIDEKKTFLDQTKNIVEQNENHLLSIQNEFNRNLEVLKEELKNIRNSNVLAKQSQKQFLNGIKNELKGKKNLKLSQIKSINRISENKLSFYSLKQKKKSNDDVSKVF